VFNGMYLFLLLDARFSMLDCGEAVPALRPVGILPAVGSKGRMPSPRIEPILSRVKGH
jgi:hypothetical protein